MTTRQYFRATMQDRRSHPRHSIEWQYLTRAARKLAWIMRGVPAKDLTE